MENGGDVAVSLEGINWSIKIQKHICISKGAELNAKES